MHFKRNLFNSLSFFFHFLLYTRRNYRIHIIRYPITLESTFTSFSAMFFLFLFLFFLFSVCLSRFPVPRRINQRLLLFFPIQACDIISFRHHSTDRIIIINIIIHKKDTPYLLLSQAAYGPDVRLDVTLICVAENAVFGDIIRC